MSLVSKIIHGTKCGGELVKLDGKNEYFCLKCNRKFIFDYQGNENEI
jgi:hypothetical protein